MRPVLLAALCVLFPIAASAQAFRSESKLPVVSVSVTDFEVVETRTAGPRGYWCAAADFARSRLGLNGSDRVYIKSGRGPSRVSPGHKGVLFTTDPGSLSVPPSKGYTVSLTTEGYNLRTSHAYSFCSDYRFQLLFR